MVSRSPRVAIIGAGMAGLACARGLADHGVTPVLFDKGRGLGGRLSTRRAEGVQFDHGAQYLTAETDGFQAMLDEAEGAGAVARWPSGDGSGYVGVPGMTGLAKHLAKGLNVRQSIRVTGVSQSDAGWQVAWAGGAEGFDRVVLTVPAPQAMELLAGQNMFVDAIKAVRMDPCLALMFALPEGVTVDFDTMQDPKGPISWIARDSSKPRRPDATCLVAHASADFSRKHLERHMVEVADLMLPLVARMLCRELPPNLPYLAAHRWRYALVAVPVGQPFLANETATLYAGGDWCLGARAEDAWTSGSAIADCLVGQNP
ncbi:MAG: FAD-dependent oxidoreductase [Pseudomonadota bacterium]